MVKNMYSLGKSQESEMPHTSNQFRVMNNSLFRIKWVKMPAAMFSTHLSVSAKLIRMLNLEYCMSLCDSSFGAEGQKRELLDLKKRASARASNCENIFLPHEA